ncbi:hypothetical protein Q9L58_010514, partial [Maublancomyces gigas]
MAGDFNSHHALWYAELSTSHHDLIHNNKAKAASIINYTQTWGFELHNIPGTLTHFPSNGNRPSI